MEFDDALSASMDDFRENTQDMEIPESLPMMAVRDVVVFNYMIIPLFVGRPGSIEAVNDAMNGDKLLMLVTQKDATKDQLPPEYPDGLIKSATCYNRPIYKEGKQPDQATIELLINKYYTSYHKQLMQALKNPKVLIALDCHSMAAIAPEVSPDRGRQRPLINLGDAEGQACPAEITEKLRRSFMEVFGFQENEVTINDPFKGGFITRYYGNKPIPWIQIEMNRKLYLSEEYFDYTTLLMKGTRLKELNDSFRKVLIDFYSISF